MAILTLILQRVEHSAIATIHSFGKEDIRKAQCKLVCTNECDHCGSREQKPTCEILCSAKWHRCLRCISVLPLRLPPLFRTFKMHLGVTVTIAAIVSHVSATRELLIPNGNRCQTLPPSPRDVDDVAVPGYPRAVWGSCASPSGGGWKTLPRKAMF